MADRSSRSEPARDQSDSILDVVVMLLVEDGFKQLTMDAVARRARVSKQTIYRRWSSKAELVVAAVRWLASPGAPGSGMPDTGTLHGDLMALLRSMCAELIDSDYLSVVALLALSRRADHDLDGALAELSVERRRPFRDVAERAVKRRELREEDVDTVIDGVVGAVFLRHLFRRVAVEEEDLEAIVSTVVYGGRSSTAERPTLG